MKNELSSNAAAPSEESTKKKKAKAKAKAAAVEAAPAPKSKAKAKAKAASRGGNNPNSPEEVAKTCFFFNHDGCNKDRCAWLHVHLSKVEREKMVRPARSSSPLGGKGTGAGKGKGKGKGKPRERSRTASPATGRSPSTGPAVSNHSWCHKFLLGTCTYTPCRFKHMSQEAVDKLVKMRDANK